MAGCMGLVNEGLVPPFMPEGRNEDGVFGLMVSLIDPDTMFGHLPIGVVHDSGRPALYEDRRMRSATDIRMCDIVRLLATSAARSSWPELTPAARLSGLASALGECGRLGLKSFERYVASTLLANRVKQLVRIDDMLSAKREYPSQWRLDLERYRESVIGGLRNRQSVLPTEAVPSDGFDVAIKRTRTFVCRLSELLSAWPVLLQEVAQR
jgi:hypothetical protein